MDEAKRRTDKLEDESENTIHNKIQTTKRKQNRAKTIEEIVRPFNMCTSIQCERDNWTKAIVGNKKLLKTTRKTKGTLPLQD